MVDPTSEAPRSFLDKHPGLVYTGSRLGLFVLVLPPMYLAGMRGILLLAFALVVSGLLSLVLLNGLRARMSGEVSGFFSRMNARIDAASRAEDDDEDDAVPQPPTAGASAPDRKPEA
jgi:hypothetical protein